MKYQETESNNDNSSTDSQNNDEEISCIQKTKDTDQNSNRSRK